MILHFFEKIDLLGSKFHFYYGVSLQKRTPLGGILTILIGGITITFLFIFGKDLFLKRNPNVTISIQNDSLYEYIDLKKENITFAFRMENKSGQFQNISNILYLKILYYSSEPDDNGKYNSKIKEEYINYHICNDSDFMNENLTKNYGTLYCPDTGEKIFGGYFDNPYMYYFELQIYFCENGSKYSINNNCTSMDTLRNFFDQDDPIFLSFFYPVVEFDPLSYDEPLRMHHKNYYYNLNHKSQRADQFFLKKTILADDKGLLFNDIKNIYIWGIDKMSSSYKYFSESDLTTEGSSSKIYTLTIFNTVENNYYTRHYTKFQNVFAIVGTLINLILNFCIFITHSIGESLRKLEILNDFFEFKDKNENSSFYKRNNTHNNVFNFRNISPEMMPKQSSFKKKKKILFNNQFFTTFPKKSLINNNALIQVKTKNQNFHVHQNTFENKINNTDKSNNKFFQHRNSVPLIGTNSINYDNSNFKRSNLTLRNIICENIQIYLFFCCNNKNYTKYFNMKHSNLLQYYYIYLIQVNRYLKIVHEYHFLKKAFLNTNQIKSLFFLRRINLTNKMERESISENKNSPYIEENVVEYFKNQISSNELSKFDKLILTNLSHNIKEKII